jgi:ribonucleoside-diphosphate reductase alpha chain
MDVREWLGEDNELGIDIWCKKYQYGTETFDEWLDRVSGGNSEIKELIKQKKFLFGGRILANRGIPGKKTYSNCYVLEPPEDNLESIFDTAKKLARTFSYGGGVGIDLGKLAPKDAKVNNTAKKSSGAVSFMELYNTTTGLIGQNGRRGALMLSMPVYHPDIEDFIGIKSDLNKITNANISVRVDDEFMLAVVDDKWYELKFYRPENDQFIQKTVKARELFHKICEMNWNYAEPGILFWDIINNWNLLQYDENFEYAGTNPCAEEPLPAGGSCLLGAINLAEFVEDAFTSAARFNTLSFRKAVRTAVRALNEVLDEGLEMHPLSEQRESVRKWRQIGLGIMGLADCLIKLGFTYGDESSNFFCEQVAQTMFEIAVLESDAIGGELGAYEEYNDYWVNSCNMLTELALETKHLRNSQLLTIAPTGTISTMLGVSGGIEPIFANSYTRKTQSLHGKDVYYKVYTPIVEQFMKKHKLDSEEQLPSYFVVSSDITPENRIKCQAAWQHWIDASISSTINLPNEATVEDIENIYLEAWKHGLKGVTIYRSGCAREGVLTTTEKSNSEPKTEVGVKSNIGLERHLTTGCGSLHVCAYFDANGNLKNTYLSKGSTGGCNNFMIGLSRMISLAARNGMSIHEIVDQLNSCGTCPSYAVRRATKKDTSPGSCCPVAIGKALIDMWKEVNQIHNISNEISTKVKCPECGEALVFEGGCNTCKNCGYSKCD